MAWHWSSCECIVRVSRQQLANSLQHYLMMPVQCAPMPARSMTLLFNLVKNFVWSDSWKQQPASSTPAVEGKASEDTTKKPASRGRRPPKA